MTNKYKGTVSFNLDGKTYDLRYTWGALSEIKSKYGEDVLSNLFSADPVVLAGILALGVEDGSLASDDVMKISPPLNEIIIKIDEALAIAYFGADGAKALGDEVAQIEKKTKSGKRIK